MVNIWSKCDRVRTMRERNPVRRSVFFKRWTLQVVIIIHEVEFKADSTAAFFKHKSSIYIYIYIYIRRNRAWTQIMQKSILRLRCSYRKCLKNKTECRPFFGTVPPVFSSKICKKQDGVLAFFTRKTISFRFKMLVLCLQFFTNHV